MISLYISLLFFNFCVPSVSVFIVLMQSNVLFVTIPVFVVVCAPILPGLLPFTSNIVYSAVRMSRSIVISFRPIDQRIYLFCAHIPTWIPISSILLCLSIVVDCRVDIESSLSRHLKKANHQCILATHQSCISSYSTKPHFRMDCNIQQYICCVTPSVDCWVSSLFNYSMHCVHCISPCRYTNGRFKMIQS